MNIEPDLSQMPKYYEDIVDIAPIGILTFDYNERILIINQQMAYYFNKSPRELVGKNIKVVMADINPEILIIIDAVKNRRSMFQEFFPANFSYQKIYFNIKGVVLPEQGLLIFENVTGTREYQEELKSLDKAKNEFISIASHDLRTPITAIRGYLDMVLKEEVGVISTPKMKEYLNFARQGTLKLNKLIEDMLSVSRIEQKRTKFELQDTKIEPLITDILNQLKPIAIQKNLKLEFNKPSHPLEMVQIDKSRFSEILTNLVGNAIKFTNVGGIAIQAIARNDHIRIDCIDTGIGIDSKNHQKIFDKFAQLNNSSANQQGTGLGLFIAKMLTEKMGGRIGLTSKMGQGSDFFFTLPITNSPIAKRVKDDIKQETLAHHDQK